MPAFFCSDSFQNELMMHNTVFTHCRKQDRKMAEADLAKAKFERSFFYKLLTERFFPTLSSVKEKGNFKCY